MSILYESSSLISDIIDSYDKSIISSAKISNPNVGEVVFATKRPVRRAEELINKKGLLFSNLEEPIYDSYFYEVSGDLAFDKWTSGIIREAKNVICNSNIPRFFLEDDMLNFTIKIYGFDSFDKVNVCCSAKNIKCFQSHMDKDLGYDVYTVNSLDPGILTKTIAVNAIIQVNQIDIILKTITASALFIERKYGKR